RLDEQQSALKAVANEVGRSLDSNPAFQARRKGLAALAEIEAQSLRKTEQAEADREQKGRPYRDDPLFMYLWEAGYGTSGYRANNLVAWLDGKVAALIGFPEARPNFSMLNEIPLRLREHADRQQANAKEAEDEL